MSDAGNTNPPALFLPDDGNVFAAVNQLHTIHNTLVADLNAYATSMILRLSTLEKRTQNAESTLTAISTNISTLLSCFPTPVVNTAGASTTSTGSLACPIKGTKLSQSSGKAQDVERFLTNLRDNIKLQGLITFTMDYQKCIYMHFCSTNKVKDCLCKLKALKQTGSATNYAAHFCKLSPALPQEQFFLKPIEKHCQVRAWIYSIPNGKEGDLNTLIERAISRDNRIHEF
ncbi:hypothetical protein FRC07_001956 [Ceratobasidium sp. 392]|nr:hypothetical protein FRC07_001956 [Ceratobasidium sp. 392]